MFLDAGECWIRRLWDPFLQLDCFAWGDILVILVILVIFVFKCQYGMNWFNFLKFIIRRKWPSSVLEKCCWQIGVLIFKQAVLPPSLAIPKFLDPLAFSLPEKFLFLSEVSFGLAFLEMVFLELSLSRECPYRWTVLTSLIQYWLFCLLEA